MILAAILLVLARATDRAPLPPSFASEGHEPGDDDYRPIPDQRGLFARGTSGVGWDRAFDGPPCAGTEAEQDAALARQPSGGRTEFWFYATRQQGILLSRTAEFTPARPCATSPSWSHEVDRGYVADGWIHSVDADRDNEMSAIGSWPITSSAGQYAGSFRTLQSLMARPGPDRRDRRQSFKTVAGVRSECRGLSGLVWSSVCTAASGPARGMILSAQSGDDERMMFSLEVNELRTGVALPGALFEVDRRWIGKD